jgi:hypothetical protein
MSGAFFLAQLILSKWVMPRNVLRCPEMSLAHKQAQA